MDLVLSLASLIALLCCGCKTKLDCDECTTPPEMPCRSSQSFPQSSDKDIDILFIIDNSNSMQEEQANLIRSFPDLIEALRSPKLGGPGCTPQIKLTCRIPNIRVGVVSSDLGAGSFSLPSCEVAGGDGGRFQTQPRQAGCQPPKDPWISYNEGLTNVPGGAGDGVEDVKRAFGCIAALGTGGCGFEHQLEAARRALRGCGPPHHACEVNQGFIRDGALLAIVWITDEDDCSAQKPQLFDPSQQGLTDPLGPLTSFRCTEFGIRCDKNGRQPGARKGCVPGFDWLVKVETYAQELAALKPPGRVITFAIAGPTEPFDVGQEGSNPVLKASCQSANGIAVPAVRMEAVTKSFGTRGLFNKGVDGQGRSVEVNSCSTSFGPAMRLLGEVLVSALGEQCLNAPPLTSRGAIACDAGRDLAPGVKCQRSCLDAVDCVVEETRGPLSIPTVVQQCAKPLFDDPAAKDCSPCPCWRIAAHAECDPAAKGSPYALQILRTAEPAKGTVAIARCATTSNKWLSEGFGQMRQCD